MCIDKNCDCLDKPCCTLRTKALFYAYWTLVHHVILVIGVIYSLIEKFKSDKPFLILCMNLVIVCIFALSWILMLFGIYTEKGTIYIIGLVMSWFIALFFIYTIVVSIIFTIICTRYYFFHLRKPA